MQKRTGGSLVGGVARCRPSPRPVRAFGSKAELPPAGPAVPQSRRGRGTGASATSKTSKASGNLPRAQASKLKGGRTCMRPSTGAASLGRSGGTSSYRARLHADTPRRPCCCIARGLRTERTKGIGEAGWLAGLGHGGWQRFTRAREPGVCEAVRIDLFSS